MFFLLLRREIQDHVISLKYIFTFTVVVLLMALSVVIGSIEYQSKSGDIATQRMLNERMLESQTSFPQMGLRGFIEQKKPSILTVIDNGIDNSIGRVSRISTGIDTRLDQSRNLSIPIFSLLGNIDITFIVYFILSLFAILLTFDLIPGEREHGTLRQCFANAVARRSFILAKLSGAIIAVLFSLLVPLLFALIVLAIVSPEVFSLLIGTGSARLLIIVLMYVLYLLVVTCIGVLISSMSKSSSGSFVVLLLIWVVFVVIAPRASMVMAERESPARPYLLLQTQAQKEIAEMRDEYLVEFSSPQEWQKAAEEQRVPQFIADLNRRGQEFADSILTRYQDIYEQEHENQLRRATGFSRLVSPVSAMRFAVQRMAGSGWDRHRNYTEQLRDFQQQFRDYISETIASIPADGPGNVWDRIYRPENLEVDSSKITFNFKEEPLQDSTVATLPDIATLFVIVLAAMFLSVFAFSRYDLR